MRENRAKADIKASASERAGVPERPSGIGSKPERRVRKRAWADGFLRAFLADRAVSDHTIQPNFRMGEMG